MGPDLQFPVGPQQPGFITAEILQLASGSDDAWDEWVANNLSSSDNSDSSDDAWGEWVANNSNGSHEKL